MKKEMSRLVLISGKINRQYLQLAFTLIALVLLVLGVGAPEDGGGAAR